MNTNKYPEKEIPNDCHCVHCIEETKKHLTRKEELFIVKQEEKRNQCAECNETIRPDQWSENNFTLCIDCG